MKIFKKIILSAIFIFAISALSAQTPPPPNGGQTPEESGSTPVGGGAPIGSGIAILLALGAGYGGKKIYDYKKRNLVE